MFHTCIPGLTHFKFPLFENAPLVSLASVFWYHLQVFCIENTVPYDFKPNLRIVGSSAIEQVI